MPHSRLARSVATTYIVLTYTAALLFVTLSNTEINMHLSKSSVVTCILANDKRTTTVLDVIVRGDR